MFDVDNEAEELPHNLTCSVCGVEYEFWTVPGEIEPDTCLDCEVSGKWYTCRP